MRITESRILRIIREEVVRALREAPLDDMVGYSLGGPSAGGASIGHEIKTPEFVEGVRRLMSRTGDHWVIITVDEVKGLEGEVKTDRFRAWLRSRRFAPGAKVIVVGAGPFEGDFESPEWILHDIIGHTAGRAFLDDQGFVGLDAGDWLKRSYGRRQLVAALHALLRDSGAPVSGASEPFDRVYDIFASIVLGYLSYEDAHRVALERDDKVLVREMFAAAESWVDSIPSDGTRATVVTPW